MNVFIDDLKFGANISVDLKNSQTRITGKFEGYVMPEKQSIILGNTKGPENSNSGTLIVNCDNIRNMITEEIQPKEPDLNLVKITNKPMLPTWIAGNKASLFKTSTTPIEEMQTFCKELFSNCNFAQLLQEMVKENKTKIRINLPTYYAQIFREPKIFLFENMQQEQMMISEEDNAQNQSLAMVKHQQFDGNIMSLEWNMCTLTISEADNFDNKAENSENSLVMDVSDDFENLNFNSHGYNPSLYESVEVDLSNLKLENSVTQIKIGNLIFKSYAQALTDGAMNSQNDESLMED